MGLDQPSLARPDGDRGASTTDDQRPDPILAQRWRPDLSRLSLGIYEKALPAALTWPERLAAANRAGFDFVEISIDDTDGRIARLDWGPRELANLRAAVLETGVPIKSMSLSAHRRFPLGSASEVTRQRARDILKKAIDFSVAAGIRLILIAGIDVYHEPGSNQTETDLLKGLEQGLEWASTAGVMLALENWDIRINSIRKARQYVDYFQSPWFQLYADVGNLAFAGYDVVGELEAGRGHIAAVHFKDTLRGQLRYVPLGEGEVPFAAACAKLADMGFMGPAVIELWTEAYPAALEIVAHANRWMRARIAEGYGSNAETLKLDPKDL
jgi:L-ribulose-5-phosphate 3-epimerase